MRRSTALALLGVLLLAAILRLFPLSQYLHWGSDFGEYYALTRALISDGRLPLDYRGWGVTYPWFPGMFTVTGAAVFLGASPDAAVSFLVPLLASFGVLPTFLLAARVTGDDLASLLAAAFVAVVMLHVFPTSHAVPAALGDFLLLGALVMFVDLRRQRKLFLPLVLTALAIVVTHHLTTYVFFLASASALALRIVLDSRARIRTLRAEFAFLAILGGATPTYWVAYAKPFWSLVVQRSPVSSSILFAVFPATIIILLAMASVRSRWRWRFRPRLHSVRGAAVAVGMAGAAIAAIMGSAILGTIPGTSIRVEPAYLVPLFATFGFVAVAAAGRKFADVSPAGPEVTAWFPALVASMIVGALFAAEVLIPYRHLEYVAIPLSVFAGAGWRWLTLGSGQRGRTIAAGLAVLVVSGSAAGAFPPPAALAGFQEGISGRVVEAAFWVDAQGGGLTAGDHRVSSVVFGFGGADATWDRERNFWHTANCQEAIDAMRTVRIPGRAEPVRWLVLDRETRAGVQLTPFEPALPLTPEEEAKFHASPFEKSFDSGGVQVYYVNWGLACP